MLTTAQPPTSELDKGRRFQFRLSQLFWLVLIMAVVIQQVLSPDWTVAERWLLICWFVGWVSGLTIGHARGTRAIFTATIGGTLCGFGGALVLYFGFSDLVRRRTMSFHDEVLLPLLALLVLAAVSSALFAASLYGVVYARKELTLLGRFFPAVRKIFTSRLARRSSASACRYCQQRSIIAVAI